MREWDKTGGEEEGVTQMEWTIETDNNNDGNGEDEEEREEEGS